MKPFRIVATILVFTMFLWGTSSCVIHQKKDNGKHLGWYKTPDKHNKGKSMLWKSSSKKSYNAHFKQPGKRKVKGKNK